MDGSGGEEVDLYEVLGISKSASRADIKKAYHKAALTSHPDKVPSSERSAAEIRFKSISQAYEILSDDQKRSLYDQHGMAAFEAPGGPGGPGGADMNDLLREMFGMNMGGGGGMPGMGGGAGPRRQAARGEDEEQQYEITLEEAYKGKTTRFSSTKNIICSLCTGTGGKANATPKTCETCGGRGALKKLVQIGPGMVSQAMVPCSTCSGAGTFFKEKDRCKKCKGARVVSAKKLLELYIPPGSREGEKIVLAGEADQNPDQREPGDIVFHLVEVPHKTFRRAGPDLACEVEVTLAEALTGFSRVVVVHLDGRGIKLDVGEVGGTADGAAKEGGERGGGGGGRILRPDQILKIPGEGMPIKRSDTKGDLYLIIKIKFPEDGFIKDSATISALREILPKPDPEIQVKGGEVDEVEAEWDATLEEFGGDSGDPRGGAQWEDDDEEAQGATQCAQQ